MGLGSSPPEQRTPQENHATLLISWWATLCALFIILTRVIGRYVRTERLFMEDKIMAWAIIPLLIRQAFVHVVLLYGTNNTTTIGLTAEEIYHRSIGSRLVLAARIFYAMFIWISKLTVSEFLKRLTTSTWNRQYERVLQGIRAFLLLTFIGVVISTLSECHPFDHYWQVVPDPGPSCRNGYAQLFVMGISDIITDVVIILFPLPVILRSSMPIKRKISLCLLYSLSAFLIAISAYRIPAIVNVHGRQQRRSLWASIEILASAACSNAVIIGSFVRDRGVKKQKYRAEGARNLESADAPSFNRIVTRQHWGNDSDEDLFKSVRGRMSSLASDALSEPRKPDIFERLPTIHSPRHGPASDLELEAYEDLPYLTQERHASENISLHDAGGLLSVGDSTSSPYRSSQSYNESVYVSDFAIDNRRRGLSPSISDSSRSRQGPSSSQDTQRGSLNMNPGEAQRYRPTLPPNGRPSGPGDDLVLSDAGGLLS